MKRVQGLAIRTGVSAGRSPHCDKTQRELDKLQDKIDAMTKDADDIAAKFGADYYQTNMNTLTAHLSTLQTFFNKECVS